MYVEGTLAENLSGAIASAKRLRGRRVYQDTFEYGRELLDYARARARRPRIVNADEIAELSAELEVQLFAHQHRK